MVAGEERFYDAIALFGGDGELLRNYRKTHLWGPMKNGAGALATRKRKKDLPSRCNR
jgi:predicted amidohydrolase